METKHTPEPWYAIGINWIQPKDADCFNIDYDKEEFKASEQRAVACVNACKGIPSQILEDATGPRHPWQMISQQRDELLAALEGLFEHCAMIHKHWGEGSNAREADAAQQYARAAIARAKGEA